MDNLHQLYTTMLHHMGPTGWWPADSKYEIILGAFLVQNTNWNNVELSLANLHQATQLDPVAIRELSRDDLEVLIRPSGFYKNKAKGIQDFFHWFAQYENDWDLVNERFTTDLRSQLLSIHGVGQETADVLGLYVFDRVTFVSDSYARRLFHALTGQTFTNYQQLHRLIDIQGDFSLQEAQEFHGLIDEFGKQFLSRNPLFHTSFLSNFDLEL